MTDFDNKDIDLLGKKSANTDQLVRNLDLLRVVVSEKVELDFTGYGLCPFHEEKTPSFHIFKARSGRARYYCFGCGVSGDIFNYLRAIDDLDFSEAIGHLGVLLNREVETKPRVFSPRGQRIPHPEFCERDCEKYIRLREDYDLLLAENERLRDALGLPEFHPFNETNPNNPQ